MRMIVVKPGWLTTVQDAGRLGYRQYGVPVSGAMDRIAYTLANRLVGNDDAAAALEMTLKGPELLFEHNATIAVTGAEVPVMLDGQLIPLWTTLAVRSGSRLACGTRRSGARAYLAVAGGLDVPPVFGSRSTHVATKMGGWRGRALASGAVLTGSGVPRCRFRDGHRVPMRIRPTYSASPEVRVLPGPQRDQFTREAWQALTATPYVLSSQSDRMGYRLGGARLPHAVARSWISDGTAVGAIQVPLDEQPILLMVDCQTTGGYPKIAGVISADLHLVGQLAPGDAIGFTVTTEAQARGAFTQLWEAVNRTCPPCRA